LPSQVPEAGPGEPTICDELSFPGPGLPASRPKDEAISKR